MSCLRKRHKEEDGIALVTVLLAVLIITGLVLVMVSRSMTETRASASARDFETAVHAAEAATDNQLRAINRDDDHFTLDGEDPAQPIVMPSTMGDERSFVLDQLDRMRGSEGWIEGERGEAYAFRPVANNTTDEPVDVVYAAAALPSFDHERRRIRVLKLQIAQDRFIPHYAIMTDGRLDFGGNASVMVPGCDTSTPELAAVTCQADIHTNSNFTNQGNAHSIQGKVSIAGGECNDSINSIGCSGASDGTAEQDIPSFVTRDFYRPDAELNNDPDGQTMDWFDLCPDGKVRAGDEDNGPCAPGAEVVWPEGDDPPTHFRGWEYRSSQNEWSSTNVGAGAFYVYRSDASINGSAGDGMRSVSVLVEGDPANPTRSGSLALQGNPDLQAAMDDVLFITDRDLRMRGTASGGTGDACGDDTDTYAGFIGVGEQATVRSNVTLRGAMLVQDKEDVHGLVQRNNDGISGNMCLQYDSDLDIRISGFWVITFWNEV